MDLIGQLQIQVNKNVFLKDPKSSELGKKIVAQGALLIDEIGLECFTFGKLAKKLHTTESSIYRYFENKHKLLNYLVSWYWSWMEYQLVFSMANLASAEAKLSKAIKALCTDMEANTTCGEIDLVALNRIVISEASKAYLTKMVNDANKEGFYAGYKSLVARISDVILEIDKDFKYPHTLVSTIVEGIHHQKYFADHLPALTDIQKDWEDLAKFFTEMALASVKSRGNYESNH